ncbi:hypothetical protein SASPL_151090 [Salvia splendens]|uniref:Uncharacterized protein n=1 Tax=Salvia splendens TaxID=180675 RepID=A0A8X8W7E0_SALSN|nr:hypothetical protein SASPL_151090 [Salvia splendens]
MLNSGISDSRALAHATKLVKMLETHAYHQNDNKIIGYTYQNTNCGNNRQAKKLVEKVGEKLLIWTLTNPMMFGEVNEMISMAMKVK